MSGNQTRKAINYTIAYLKMSIDSLKKGIEGMDDSDLTKRHLQSLLYEQERDLQEFEGLADKFI